MISGLGHRKPEAHGQDAPPSPRAQDLVVVPRSRNAVHGNPVLGGPDAGPVHPDGSHEIREEDPRSCPEDPNPEPLPADHRSWGTDDPPSVHEEPVVTLHPPRKNGLQTGALPHP